MISLKPANIFVDLSITDNARKCIQFIILFDHIVGNIHLILLSHIQMVYFHLIKFFFCLVINILVPNIYPFMCSMQVEHFTLIAS